VSTVETRLTKKNSQLTLLDKLSLLSYTQTLKLLGGDAAHLLRAGSKWDVIIEEHVSLSEDLFRLTFPEDGAAVTIRLDETSYERLKWNCSDCERLCEHIGAAFSLILEEKTALGLAAPPPERTAVESLSDEKVIEQAMQERIDRARSERMIVKSANPDQPWTDYTVTSKISGKTYRVALRGRKPGESYCSCADFRKNTLGACKHILHVAAKLPRRFTAAQLRRPYRRKTISVHIHYGERAELRLLLPDTLDSETEKTLGHLRDREIADVPDLIKRIQHLERTGRPVNIYPDAEEFIQTRLLLDRLSRLAAEIRRAPEAHPLRRNLLKVELLPYQLDGIAFIAGAGRAVLADDMGLGKTIQAIGAAELLAREAGISKVLVVCPASLKSQWRNEIDRFGGRGCQLLSGSLASRATQ
jgi:hypothetical protein